ncbi:hypothetical protein ACGF12_21195 [Kitasatospora sp. NPDC048296]|uniref:hypothetical protein n=1 Tax=Kitasatospora sp. NPDC048296 TaxID=3364048 RepID=UPI00371F418D
MPAESGEGPERDPVQAFVDEAFEEMMREMGIPQKTAKKYGKDPLVAALIESAVATMAQPASPQVSELERMLFAQALATALAEALAPVLAESLSAEIVKVLNRRLDPKAGSTESATRHSGRSAGQGTSATPQGTSPTQSP